MDMKKLKKLVNEKKLLISKNRIGIERHVTSNYVITL